MIYTNIDSFQTGQCEECGCRTYRVIYIANYAFYLCNKCTEALFNTLKCDEEIFNRQFMK